MLAITSLDHFKTQVLDSDHFVIVDFWSASCAPCELLNQVLADLEPNLPTDTKVVKVDVDEHIQIADLYRVIIMPTLKIFKNGQVIKDLFGLCTPEDIQSTLETLRKS